MKIFVEQIVVDQGILVYSNFFKFTDSEDEEGNDFEYDFEGIYGNVDNIQTTILKLYGTQGLVKIFTYFAEGRQDLMTFESLEFEEGSPIKDMVSKLVSGIKTKDFTPVNDIIEPRTLKPVVEQPTDSIFLLSGLLAGLPLNEDLNVMRMLTKDVVKITEEEKNGCLNIARNFGIDESDIKQYFGFVLNGNKKVVLVSEHTFLSFTITSEGIVIDFPANEIQEKTFLLFNKYINIKNVSVLKKSLIFETEYNNVAKSETNETLPNYLILYNVEMAKFESKEKYIK